MNIRYSVVDKFEGWDKAERAVLGMVLREKSQEILEIGAGANPTLPVGLVQSHNLKYTTNDISPSELSKASPVYKTLCLDFTNSTIPDNLIGKFDFVFSRMVNEHIKDGRQYYKNIFSILRSGGLTAHWFSTLYALPFVVNRFIPESLSSTLLNIFAPRDRFQHDKFKAYYNWSRGPTKQMQMRFKKLGFEVVEYVGYFGHEYYLRKCSLLREMEMKKARFLASHPFPLLTSYAFVTLRKR